MWCNKERSDTRYVWRASNTNNNESDEQSCTLTSVETPVVLNIINSPYGGNPLLWRITCDGETIWVSGNNGTNIQLDRNGSILKNINLTKNVIGLSINVPRELVFCFY